VSRTSLFLCLALAIAAPASPQPASRTATTLEALSRFPLFFHGRQVVVRGTVEAPSAGLLSLRAGEGSRPVFLLWRGDRGVEEGPAQITGEFWDLGRLTPDDPRLAGLGVEPLLATLSDGRWPGHNQVLVLLVQSAGEPERLPDGLRAIALEPERFEGRTVTVAGRFRGANLFGDLPQAPGGNRSAFVIQSVDAAVWITGKPARGRGFNFDETIRLDTGRTLEVTGTVRREHGLVRIEATQVALAATPAPAAIVEAPAPVQGPPPSVAFSLPVDEETDVAPGIKVRVQFTRDMDPGSFKDRVRVSYVNANAAGPAPRSTATYRPENRVLEVTFAAPLERFSTVKVELLDGITASDGAPLAPWSMTFSIGSGP